MNKTRVITPIRKNLLQRKIAKKNMAGKLVLTKGGKQKLLEKIGLSEKRIEESKKSISEYIREAKNRWTYGEYDKLFAIIRKQLHSLKGKRILEIGFGISHFARVLEKQGAIIMGIDAKKELRAGIVPNQLVGNALKLPCRKNSIDCIFSSSVFESGSGFKYTQKPYRLVSIGAGELWLGKEKARELREENEKAKTEFLREIRTALKPKGIFVAQTYLAPWISKKEFEENGFSVAFVKHRGEKRSWQYLIARKTR